ncbi:MAG: GNAT family N-acetyltransferase [Pseudomonadota bacterium]
MTDAAPYKYAKSLEFRPVDPVGESDLLIRYGRDLYRESLGDDHAFRRDYGWYGERFPDWIQSCGAADPSFAALLTEDVNPIGLVALAVDPQNPKRGRVHHFYIEPGHRGQGFGGLLDDYARARLASAGCERIRLNVTKTNDRARRFYEAQGWSPVRSGFASARLCELEIAL